MFKNSNNDCCETFISQIPCKDSGILNPINPYDLNPTEYKFSDLNNTKAENFACGKNSLKKTKKNKKSIANTAIGTNTLENNNLGNSNTAVGHNALNENKSGSWNTAVGTYSLKSNISGEANTAVGSCSLLSNTIGFANTAVGEWGLFSNTTGSNNTANGTNSLYLNTTGSDNTASGLNSLLYNTTGSSNTANGRSSLVFNTTGSNNTAMSRNSLRFNTTGSNNTAIGRDSLLNNTTGSNNTAVGLNALSFNEIFDNTTGLGANSEVDGDNQVQLGDSQTTTYAYGSVQNRSDQRDKTDIRDTVLGLDFINKLRPVDFRWDYREDYREIVEEEINKEEINKEINKEESTKKIIEHEKDGSKARKRFHHGLIAQEVQKVIRDSNIDFGGFQDHKINGGKDVLSIGYSELVGPLIKAVQELTTQVNNLKQENELIKKQLGIQ
jgi:hypothetical protein